MGKALIIKGADFSAVAVASIEGGYWLLRNDGIDNSNTNLNNERTFWPSGEEVSALIRGKHVTKFKFKCGAVGTVVIYKASTMLASTAVLTQLASITTTSEDVGNVLEKDVDFVFPDDGYLAVNNDVSGVALYLYDTDIQSQTKLNPVYTNVDAKVVPSRYFNNDFYISY